MKITTMIITLFFILCNSVFAAQWLKFYEDEETKLYYDAGSYQCFRSFDRRSGITTGYTATVWIKTSKKNNSSEDNMVLWSIDCSGRKIDKGGNDYPDIYGDHIKPDSLEEKIYKKICPVCRRAQYNR